MAVVTISRQFGAGGLRVARTVGEALGFQMVDREIAEQAASRLGVDPEIAEGKDERAPAIVEQLGMALAAGTAPFGTAPPPQLDQHAVDSGELAEATRLIILSLADAGGYVILGRGGAAALAGMAGACHVSLVGDLEDRMHRIMRWRHINDPKVARRMCEDNDGERAAYVKHFYGRDVRDPLLYDCVLNTSRLGVEGAAEVAITVARRKLAVA